MRRNPCTQDASGALALMSWSADSGFSFEHISFCVLEQNNMEMHAVRSAGHVSDAGRAVRLVDLRHRAYGCKRIRTECDMMWCYTSRTAKPPLQQWSVPSMLLHDLISASDVLSMKFPNSVSIRYRTRQAALNVRILKCECRKWHSFKTLRVCAR